MDLPNPTVLLLLYITLIFAFLSFVSLVEYYVTFTPQKLSFYRIVSSNELKPSKVIHCQLNGACDELSKKYFLDEQHRIENLLGKKAENQEIIAREGSSSDLDRSDEDDIIEPEQNFSNNPKESNTNSKKEREIECTKEYVDPPNPPVTDRKPEQFRKIVVDLFSHPVAKETFESLPNEVKELCFVENNIEIFVNQELVKKDLIKADGWTVFNLDCRNHEGKPQVAFLVILGLNGEIGNILPLKQRAQSVNMKDGSTVLFSCNGLVGSYLWNWREGSQPHKLPFVVDSHALWYVPSRDAYFAAELPTKEGGVATTNVVGFSAEGEKTHHFTLPRSHINYITVAGDFIFLSLRDKSSLQILDLKTGDIVEKLGGYESTYFLLNQNATPLKMSGDGGAQSWHNQHKFQHIDDHLFSLFDNNMDGLGGFVDDRNSRMVILDVDANQKFLREHFSFDIGEKSMIYGGADILPSGNVLGNSYPDVVYPSVEDRKYHQNIWEVTEDGKIAWRVGILGNNPWIEEDKFTPYWRAKGLCEEGPTGWVIYNVERFYDAPIISEPCFFEQDESIRFMAFNNIRSQDPIGGMAGIFDSSGLLITSTEFRFHKSFLPVDVALDVSKIQDSFSILIVNDFGDNERINLPNYSSLPVCKTRTLSETRYF